MNKTIVKRALADKVLIKKIEEEVVTEAGLHMPSDSDYMPKAEVIKVSEEIKGALAEGDKIYYIPPREKGKVLHNGEELYLIPIANCAAIYEQATKETETE